MAFFFFGEGGGARWGKHTCFTGLKLLAMLSILVSKKIFQSKIGISIDDTRHSLFFLLQSLLHRSRHEEVSFNVFEDLINESNFI